MTMRTAVFGPLDIEYDEHVLEPRLWTLAQSRWAAELLSSDEDAAPLLELCAGAGQIGLTAAALSYRAAVLVDSSEHACRFAARNAAAAGLSDRVDVRHGPMEEVMRPDESFALVLADPPYIPSAHTGTFPFDPLTAIDGGDDGLELARTCLRVGAGHLRPGGPLLLQLRDGAQADQLATELRGKERTPLEVVEIRDFPGGGLVLHLVRTDDAPGTDAARRGRTNRR
jgi:release factor glutamine methyltransferase